MLPAGRSPGIWADEVVTRSVAPAAAMNAEMRMGPPRGLIIGLARLADSWTRGSAARRTRPHCGLVSGAAVRPRLLHANGHVAKQDCGEAARPSPYEARTAESYECVKP